MLFGWYSNGRGRVAGAVSDLANYVDDAIVQLEARILSRRPCNGGPATSRGFRKARRSTYAPMTTSITCSRCLPLDTTKFSETNMFVPLFRATKQALSSEPLLPRFDAGQ